MKGITVILAVFSLALSLGVVATPPGGQGGARPMGTPPSHGSVTHDRSTTPPTTSQSQHEHPDMHTSGRSTSDILTNNTRLASQIHDLTGVDAQQACAGFKNLGECVSAAHVGKNLGIEFDALRAKVTGSSAQSLGQAIHDLKPDVNAKDEVNKAHKQAKDDLKSSTQ